MKRLLGIMLILTLGLSACGTKEAPPAGSAGGAGTLPGPSVSEQKEEEPEALIDYEGTPFEEWSFLSGEEEGAAALLDRINGVPYASAGASLRQLSAAAAAVELSAQPEALGAVSDYLGRMTPIQRDYFSFSWEMSYKGGGALFEQFEELRPSLADAGLEHFEISGYQRAELDELDKGVQELFKERKVTMEWRKHTDLVPFLSAAG